MRRLKKRRLLGSRRGHQAGDKGGIGYITASLADIARNTTLINTHVHEQGLAVTYRWIEGELARAGRISTMAAAAAAQ